MRSVFDRDLHEQVVLIILSMALLKRRKNRLIPLRKGAARIPVRGMNAKKST